MIVGRVFQTYLLAASNRHVHFILELVLTITAGTGQSGKDTNCNDWVDLFCFVDVLI